MGSEGSINLLDMEELIDYRIIYRTNFIYQFFKITFQHYYCCKINVLDIVNVADFYFLDRKALKFRLSQIVKHEQENIFWNDDLQI